MVNTPKSVVKQSSATDQSFKALINRLNTLSDKMDEAEAAIVSAKPSKSKLTENVKIDGTMNEIIGRFNEMIAESVKPVLLEEKSKDEFSLAVKTKLTENGVLVGNWEIVKIQEGKSLSYDIIEIDSNKVILENIKTYVAANAIVKLLNNGRGIHDAEIKTFIKLDEDFDLNYNDAIRYKNKFKKTNKAIYEDRFQVCKDRAVNLKEKMMENFNSIGRI